MMVCLASYSSNRLGNDDIDLCVVADMSTWSPTIQSLVSKGTVSLAPYDLVLDYNHWSYGMSPMF